MDGVWNQQYDAFHSSDDGYGLPFLLVPLLIGIGAGAAAHTVKTTKGESTGSRDITRMAQGEIDKADDPIPKFNSDEMKTGVLHGAADQGEAYAISAFWLARVSRVALYKGDGVKASQLLNTAKRYLSKARMQFGTGTAEILESQTHTAIARVFEGAADLVAPISVGAQALLIRLADPFSTKSRKGYQEAYSYTSQIGRPAAQTFIDVGEAVKAAGDAVAAPFQMMAWVREHKWWLIGGVGGLVLVNALVAGGVARKRAATAAPAAPSRSRRRRYSE